MFYIVLIKNNKIISKSSFPESFELAEGYFEITQQQFKDLKYLPATFELDEEGEIINIVNAPEPPEFVNEEQINKKVSDEINAQYDINKQIQILREALAGLGANTSEFVEFSSFVEEKKLWGQNKKAEL